MKKALITGITGQDGAYLAEFLLEKGYEVHGIKRRSSSFNTERIDHLIEKELIHLHYGDLSDSANLIRLVQGIRPDEIYNLGAQSHVKVSFDTPEYTANVDALGTLRLLEAIRICGLEKKIKFYQASTSELYGMVKHTPQNEDTPFYPRSPYACAKLYAYWIVVNYREAYGMFACNGILFNHESPLRGETFVTRKITRAVARIALGLQETVTLGNIDSKRDWGHAKDYVEAMWLMLQTKSCDDFVISTGTTTTVRDFLKKTFQFVGIELRFEGKDENEIAVVKSCSSPQYQIPINQVVMRIDPKYYRPTEVDLLLGDSSKAKEKLGWTPKYNLDSLVEDMMTSDLSHINRDVYLVNGGHKIRRAQD